MSLFPRLASEFRRLSLGFKYANGEGVLKDESETVRWYRLAAEQGHAGAQNALGWGLGIAGLHAQLSWIEETALRRRAGMESPRGGDRRSEDFNLTECEVETGAEMMHLSRARACHADLSDTEFAKMKADSLAEHTPTTPRLFREAGKGPRHLQRRRT